MTDVKHTAGEWAFECQPFGCAIHVGGMTIATTYSSAAITKLELPYVENARLIAAAPELLKALQYIAKQWPDSFAARHAHAAIAKAEGRS
jgi:hypothetical protein